MTTAATYELKDRSVCPPGGFIFFRQDGSKFHGMYGPDAVNECQRHFNLSERDAWQKVLEETYCQMAPEAREYFIAKGHDYLTNQNETFRYIPRHDLLPAPYLYNASMITVDGDDYLVYRRQMDDANSTTCVMNFRTKKNFTIEMPKLYETEQFEDPRVHQHDGAIWLLVCSWRKNWVYKPHLRLFRLKPDWSVDEEVYLDYSGNGKGITQKNWVFFSHENEQYFVYQYAPFRVVKSNTEVFSSKSLHWEYGEIRGGTPPVRVGDQYITFFHSRLDHGRSRYFMGAMAFEAKAPFTPTAMTKTPLLAASSREPNLSWAPITVFPCGALHKDGKWCVSLGVNDLNCALVDYDHDELMEKMEAI